MSKVQELMGSQVVDLYRQTLERIATLRQEKRNINENIKELLEEEKDLRKFVRLFDPALLDGKNPTVPPTQLQADDDE